MKDVLVYELKMMLRDYRTLFFSVVLPILLMPALVSMVQKVQARKANQTERATYSLAVGGPLSQATVKALLNLQQHDFPFRLLPADINPMQRMRDGLYDVYVETVPGDKVKPPEQRRTGPSVEGHYLPNLPLLRIYFMADQENSIAARARMQEAFVKVLTKRRDQLLRHAGIEPDGYLPLTTRDLASSGQKTHSWLAPALPLLFLFLFLGGASVAAMDSISGERERGSLETLLLSALPRGEVIVGKQLAVLAISVGIAAIQLTNMVVFIGLGWVAVPAGFRIELTPAIFGGLAVLALTMAILVAAILLWVSTSATSFKEAQLLYFPTFIVCAAFCGAAVFPDLHLRSAACIVPLTSLALAIRDVTVGRLDWLMLFSTVMLNLGSAVLILKLASSRLLPAGELQRPVESTPREQQRRDLRDEVLWAYALAAAALLIVPGNFPALTTLLGQVLFNQGLMLSLACVLLWRHRIPLRDGLSLRMPGPLTWPICLALIPTLHLCANSLVVLTQSYLPIPKEMAEKMTQLLVPDSEPTWKLVLLLALSPAIAEEIAFRGTLLTAFRPRSRRFSKNLAVAAGIGLLFGAFHLSIYRFLPTALVGTFLTMLALMTGSIYPGMLVHFGNNAMAVLAHRAHLSFTALPGWVFAVSWVFAFALFSVLRHRERQAG